MQRYNGKNEQEYSADTTKIAGYGKFCSVSCERENGICMKEEKNMETIFSGFQRSHDYLICIDSEGCAMNTMEVKHRKSLAPCMVHEWDLGEYRDAIMRRWREISLYSMDRGINRFQALAKILVDVNENYKRVEELDSLLNWVSTAKELSNDSLKAELEKTGSPVLKKALEWSELVNGSLKMISEKNKKPFDGVREALEMAQEFADIVIVTAAGRKEIVEEWEYYDLMKYVKLTLTQETGNKEYCIRKLLECGYSRDHALMVGDAPVDQKAAKAEGIFFYPIMVWKEKESWEEFQKNALIRFQEGTFGGVYQEEAEKEFVENLSR